AVRKSELRSLLKPFVLRDGEGRPDPDHPIRVDAKTGTLNFVSALAGYITTEGGEELVFAIFTAHPERRAAIPKAERERPAGGRTWNGRAKRVQQGLIERWDLLYGA
ncbi:MAG: D-alanyl-D-alanine carboxypeptidase, partial [Sulfitobacter sp.]|nr:D-alanyl-D-alanine carboxypeptidase [Sulfitobacter sp.]